MEKTLMLEIMKSCEQQPLLFEESSIKCKIIEIDRIKPFNLSYRHKNGTLFQGDSIEWLKSLETGKVDMIFADPPYNIKKADWDKFESQEKYILWSMQWIREA
jgi:site-specific DNA-methyltransferase (adenine-specific)